MTEQSLVMVDLPEERSDEQAPAPRWADPAQPQVNVADLGVTRGDGVFETVDVVGGAAQALEPHLARLARSAAMLELPAPSLTRFRAAVLMVAGQAPDRHRFAKVVYTRGIEGGGTCTGWVLSADVADHHELHEHGIRVVLLDRGYRHDVAQTSPWLLQGAKTLSYAINKAAIREAERRGAHDVIFLSSDGFVLEGPQSSVVLQVGDRLVTPDTAQGILPGTAQADLFAWSEKAGRPVEYRQVLPAELQAADSVWMLSSVRQLVPVVEIDGAARGFDRHATAAALRFLQERRV